MSPADAPAPGLSRLLYVDDDPTLTVLTRISLERVGGFTVKTCASGVEALEVIDAFAPDLVLLDVMMPAKSGYEVCQRIRERVEWRNIKIIILTAKGRDVEVSKGLSIGADLYITKPFSTQELMARINGLLGVGAA